MSDAMTDRPMPKEKPPAVLLKEQLQQVSRVREELEEYVAAMGDMTKAIEVTAGTLLRRLDAPIVPELAGHVEEILALLRTPKTPAVLPWYRRYTSQVVGQLPLVGVLVLGWLFGGFGGCPSEVQKQAKFLAHINGILVQVYPTLPAVVKTRLDGLYEQYGVLSLTKQGTRNP